MTPLQTLDLICMMLFAYGYVLFGLSAVTWIIYHILDLFGKEPPYGHMCRIRCRTYHRRDRLLYHLRVSRIGKKRGVKL